MGSHTVGHDWSDLAAAAVCFELSLEYEVINQIQIHVDMQLSILKEC